VVKRGVLAPSLFVHFIGRVLVGFAFNKASPGLLPPNHDEKAIPVGIESIELAKAKDLYRVGKMRRITVVVGTIELART
jgi:hypothetical protein